MIFAFQSYYSPCCNPFINLIDNILIKCSDYLTLILLVFPYFSILDLTLISTLATIVFFTNNEFFK